MAYETGTPSSIQDLISKLFAFATGLVTTPWTQDELNLTTDLGTLHLGNCYVSFRWDNTTQHTLAIYQSLGWTTSLLPHQQPDDSGAGSTTSPATTGRRVNFTTGAAAANAGPYVAYHFFAGEGANPYIYVVVETSSGVFRHFGFGNLAKANDYTGGEFCFGHFWAQDATNIDNPSSALHTFMLDGLLVSSVGTNATVHLEGMPGQTASQKWGICINSASPGNDTGGNARLPLLGLARTGGWGYYLSWMRASLVNAHKLLVPIQAFYRNISTTPHSTYLLGEMPDVALVNMASLAPGDELTIGSDTYQVFPWVRKLWTASPGSNTEESYNAGVAYKKVV